MSRPRRAARTLSTLAASLVVLVSCGQSSPGSTTSCTAAPASSRAAVGNAQRLTDILDDMHGHAFNPGAPPGKNSTLPGGLFINWRGTWNGDHCTAAGNTNIRTSGQSDDTTGASPRHDPVTDLMYLRNLRAYQSTHPADHSLDADAARMDPIVRAEFAKSSYYRSWTYFQLQDLDRFQPDTGWDQPARYFAGAVYRSFYNEAAGMVVDKSHSYYRTDFAAETAAALADAGSRYQEPRFTEAARSIAANLLAHAADARTHLFPLKVGNDGSVVQAQIKMGEQAQLLDALLTVYDHLRQPELLAAVGHAVEELYSPQLGLWDAQRGGFFFSVNADGSGLQSAYKESRQAWVLALLRHLDRDAGGQTQRIAEMTTVVVDRLWQSTLHGYVYRVSPEFAVYHTSNGPARTEVVEDFVTSEAMGIAGNVLAP
jgi:hypothetical protein